MTARLFDYQGSDIPSALLVGAANLAALWFAGRWLVRLWRNRR